MEDKKCVMIIDENLPLGLIANTAAVLGNTIGAHYPKLVGSDVVDKSNNTHMGVIKIPIPILKGNASMLFSLREKLYQEEYSDLVVADFSSVAQSCKNYEEYISKISEVTAKDLKYDGIAIYGDKKKVNKLTCSIGLLR